MIVSLTRALVSEGFRVGVVKHTPHGIDVSGKDSARVREAGADTVVLVGEEEVEFRNRSSLFSLLKELSARVDVVFVEGFKTEKFVPKVCFGEAPCENCVLREPAYEEVLAYVREAIEVERIERKLPNFNCGECGHKNCHEMALAIHSGKDEFRGCRYWNPSAVVSVKVNGRDIYMGKFAQDILINTIAGLLSSFKGVKSVDEVEIKFKKSR